MLLGKSAGNRNEWNKCQNEQASVFSLSVLDINKIAVYEYWYGYAKAKFGDNTKLGDTDVDSFMVHVKSENIYKDLVGDVEQRFDTWNYKVEKPLDKQKRVSKKNDERVCSPKA